MIFESSSLEFKIAIGLIWIFPYAVLAVASRNKSRWDTFLGGSKVSIVSFSISFILFWMLGTDFSAFTQLHLPLGCFLALSLLPPIILIQALPLLIIMLVVVHVVGAWRPESELSFFTELFTIPIHILYLFDVVGLAFDYGR